jgi:tol-pal system protein YbgF
MRWRIPTLALLAIAGGPALATEPASLRGEMGRLQAEIRQIQLAQAQDPTLRTAALEVRLSRLEEQLRQLTGRIEEVEYAQRQTAARIDELVAALDARLQGPPLRGEATAAQPATEEPLTTAVPPSRQAPPSIIAPDESARQGYVLGTVPEVALRTQPVPREQPQPETQARLVPQGADATYKQALDLLQAGRWGEAEQAFEGFVRSYPDDRRTPTASYWLGETYLFRKDYPTAASVFARNYRTYGQEAPRAPDNLLKLGIALAAMGDRDKACQTYSELGKRHPNAPAPIRQALVREKTAAGCT